MSETGAAIPTMEDFNDLREKWIHDGIEKPPEAGLSPRQSLHKIENFVFNVWNHPLVTQDLVNFRKQGNDLMAETLQKFGAERSVVCIPVGSRIWAVNGRSDWDFTVLSTDAEILQRLQSSAEDLQIRQGISVIGSVRVVDPDNIYLLGSQENIFPLLATPDELLVGDIELARKYRVAIPDYSKNGLTEGPLYNVDYFWESNFVDHIKGWPVFDLKDTKKQSRFTRFEQRLTQRAAQSHNPNYLRDYIHSYDGFKAPSEKIYLPALQLSHGALHFPSHPPKTTGII